MKKQNKDNVILIRVTKEDKDIIEARLKANNFSSISEYGRLMMLKGTLEIK